MKKLLFLIRSNFILFLIIITASLIRLWEIGSVPPSLYIDELDLGYQAYSILQTGKDYFGNLLPLHPHSFAEYRTPFNIYSAIPFIGFFGINAYGIRLPSVIFGIFTIVGFYLLAEKLISYKNDLFNKNGNSKKFALIAALIITLSPWHIQFSRVTLEVSALFLFLTLGVYLFFKSLESPRYFWLSTFFLFLTPWIYSTAKFFTFFLIIFLLVVWRKEVIRFPKNILLKSLLILLILGLPMIYMTFSGMAGSRFSYISVFTDPTARTEVNFAREFDATVRGENQIGAQPNFWDKFFHNKAVFWINNIAGNLMSALSADFLFFSGDPNLRHSVKGFGQFYLIEIIPLLIGTIFFFATYKEKKIKLLIAFWILAGLIPSVITRDGGNHAPRLILILAPLVFLITYGVNVSLQLMKGSIKKIITAGYLCFWLISFVFYSHNYLVHYPLDSQRWWNYGYQQMIEEVKKIENKYEKIIITTADEPPLLFFAAYYQYDPLEFQKAITNGSLTGKNGEVRHIGKFYFDQYKIDSLTENIDKSTLYVAAAREVKSNLIMNPSDVPEDLILADSVSFSSGEPVFYFFAERE